MESYLIKGGNKLLGEVNISGSKNATLPIMAASILNEGTTILRNVPDIYDVQIMENILEYLGCKIIKTNDKIIINSNNIDKYNIPEVLMRQMRSSVMLVGAIISRMKKCVFSYPGGCEIGARPIDIHLNAFKKLNISVREDSGNIYCDTDKIYNGTINLDFPSVGATENLILASVFCIGETIIKNAAREPEIIDLQNMLNSMGAKVTGAGTNIIKIEGVKDLHDTEYKIMPDRIEAGTLLCSAAITKGKIKLKKVIPEHVAPVLHKLEECGSKIAITKDVIVLDAPKRLKGIDIRTMPYPGFPTDMQPIFASCLTIAKGTSVIIENIFENRYKYTNELIRMGAQIMLEGRSAIIKGTEKLYGANEFPSLRKSASQATIVQSISSP